MARGVLTVQEMIDRKGIAHAKDQIGKFIARKTEQAAELRKQADDKDLEIVQAAAELENGLRDVASKATASEPVTVTEPAPETVPAETPAELQTAAGPAESVQG